MRTLDEVIKAVEEDLECANVSYPETFYDYDNHKDALHYLKEFQDAKNALDAERERTIEAYCQWEDAKEKLEAQTCQMMWVDKHFQFEKSDNPLTWDELKAMEGKPVWIEFLNDEGEWNGEWCLVESSNNILCEILRCKMSWWGLRKITLGKTWQAYRKERS